MPQVTMHGAPHVAVRPGDRSRVVDALCPSAGRAWWIETGETTSTITNETMRPGPVEVKAGDRSRVVDAFRLSEGSAWWVKTGDTDLSIANETMQPEPVRVKTSCPLSLVHV